MSCPGAIPMVGPTDVTCRPNVIRLLVLPVALADIIPAVHGKRRSLAARGLAPGCIGLEYCHCVSLGGFKRCLSIVSQCPTVAVEFWVLPADRSRRDRLDLGLLVLPPFTGSSRPGGRLLGAAAAVADWSVGEMSTCSVSAWPRLSGADR